MAIRLLSSESIDGALTLTGNLTGNSATFAGTVLFNDHTTHPDQVNSYFGTGNDASIQHNGSHLFIDNSVGSSYIRNTSTGDILLRNSTGGDIQFDNEFAGNILFNTSNVERMRIDSSGNSTFAGNILMGNTVPNPASGFADQTGIGLKYSTTVPELQVSSDAAAMQLGRTTTGGDGQILGLRKEGTIITSFSTNASQFYNLTSGQTGTVVMYSEGGGEVGLTVQSRTNRGKIRVADNDSNAYVVAEAGKAFYGTSANGDTTNITVLTSGNVGIGTVSPGSKLDIGTSSGASMQFLYDTSQAYRNNISNYWNSSTDSRMDFNIGRTANVAPVTVMSVGYGGNVGIGTVTPSTKLEIFGNNSARNTLQNILAINGGTSSNNVYSGFGMGLVFSGRDYSNQPRDYAYIYGVQQASSTSTPGGDPGFTSQLTFYTNTGGAVNTLPTQKMVINALGNVGINVANPGFQAVDTYGQIGIEIKGGKENNQAPCIRLHETGSGKGSFELRSTRNILTSGNYFAIAEGTDTFFAIRADDDSGGTSTRGYVGIGTVSPTQLLNVVNDTTGAWTAKFTNNTNNVYLSVNDANNYGIYVSGESKNYFSSKIGIGTTSPDYELDVNGSIRAGRVTTNVEYYSTTNSASNQYFHIKTSVNANSQTCMHTWSIEGYAYGSTTIIDCKLAFHTDSSNNIYGLSYLGSLANNIYRSGDNYVVLVFGTLNTYYTHFYVNLFEGMYTPLNSTVLAVAYSPNNSGVY